MPNYSFFTIKQGSEVLLTEKDSKFYAYTVPFTDTEQLKAQLDFFKNIHPKASHVCFAYKINHHNYRSSDAGEPSGTAGKPILNAILAHNLEQILVVVVRYFGGNLLGVPGLIAAYKTAALQAIQVSQIIEVPYTCSYLLGYSFEQVNIVQKLIKNLNMRVIHENFTDKYLTSIELNLAQQKLFLEKTAVHYQIEITELQ
jgi:uncharacterized YigZ family protein